jgi:hypothetical protein
MFAVPTAAFAICAFPIAPIAICAVPMAAFAMTPDTAVIVPDCSTLTVGLSQSAVPVFRP